MKRHQPTALDGASSVSETKMIWALALMSQMGLPEKLFKIHALPRTNSRSGTPKFPPPPPRDAESGSVDYNLIIIGERNARGQNHHRQFLRSHSRNPCHR